MPDNDSIGPKEIQATRFASEEMIVELYTELRTMANAKLNKQPPGQTLQATALVHDVYLPLSKDSNQRWDNKGHFFATAAEAMRRILVEQARRKSASKRGGNVEKRPFHEHEIQAPEADEKTLQVNEALDLLEAEDSVKAAIE